MHWPAVWQAVVGDDGSVYGEMTNLSPCGTGLGLLSSPPLMTMFAAETSGSSSPVYVIVDPSTTRFPECASVGLETTVFGWPAMTMAS